MDFSELEIVKARYAGDASGEGLAGVSEKEQAVSVREHTAKNGKAD